MPCFFSNRDSRDRLTKEDDSIGSFDGRNLAKDVDEAVDLRRTISEEILSFVARCGLPDQSGNSMAPLRTNNPAYRDSPRRKRSRSSPYRRRTKLKSALFGQVEKPLANGRDQIARGPCLHETTASWGTDRQPV